MSGIEDDPFNEKVVKGRQYDNYGDFVYCIGAYVIVTYERDSFKLS